MSRQWEIVSSVIVYVANYCAIRSPRGGSVSLTTNQFEAHLAPGEGPRLNITIPLRGQCFLSWSGAKRPMTLSMLSFHQYPQMLMISRYERRYLRILIAQSIIEEKRVRSWWLNFEICGKNLFMNFFIL